MPLTMAMEIEGTGGRFSCLLRKAHINPKTSQHLPGGSRVCGSLFLRLSSFAVILSKRKRAEESASVLSGNALPQSVRSLDMLVQKEYTYSYEDGRITRSKTGDGSPRQGTVLCPDNQRHNSVPCLHILRRSE